MKHCAKIAASGSADRRDRSFHVRGAAIFAVLTSIAVLNGPALAAGPSCSFGKCMSICRNEKFDENRCPHMCGRIISLCRRLVSNRRDATGPRVNGQRRKHIELDARAGSSAGHMN
jgi:hypothetical protein